MATDKNNPNPNPKPNPNPNLQKRGSWMLLHSGERFYPLDPDPELIKIEDIAHSLSLLCRFNGHTPFLYTVAQHSLYVEELIAKLTENDPRARLVGLLHDASEAYLADVPRPVKPYLDGYQLAEAKVQEAIWTAFKLDPAMFANQVKMADEIILATEARDVMRINPNEWEIVHKPLPWLTIKPLKQKEVKAMFIWRARRLLSLHKELLEKEWRF